MTDNEYLRRVLANQDVSDDSDEMKDLRTQREKVKVLLTTEFGGAPVLLEGGSKAKGTMIKESYDLDLPYYFPRDDNSAGDTLKEIYQSVEHALNREYYVERKGVAVRLHDMKNTVDFRIDVVPGRFVNGFDGDAFLFPATSEKERLQTNLDTHIAHVRDSGVVDAIRLMKLWRTRKGIALKTFALELLTVDVLMGFRGSLPEQLEAVLTEFRDRANKLSIADPANSGNDLLGMLYPGVRIRLQIGAQDTLSAIKAGGWEAVFGKLPEEDSNEALRRISLASPVSRPWCDHG